MKTFKQLREQLVLVTEARGTNQKGWVNYKTKKIVLWNFKASSGKPWHIQFVCNNPRKFGITEKKILSILAEAGWIDPNEGKPGIPDAETQKNLDYLKSGVHDTQDELRQHLESNGWMEFYNESDRGLSGGSWRANARDLHNAAKTIEKTLDLSATLNFDKFRQIRLWGSSDTTVHITDRFSWKTFLNTGKVAKQRSALAAFR